MYHLTVAAGSSATFKVGTEYEQLIGNLLDADGDPGADPHALYFHCSVCVCVSLHHLPVLAAATMCYFDPQTALIQPADCVYDGSSMCEAASAVESFETRFLCVCACVCCSFPRIGLVEERGLELL